MKRNSELVRVNIDRDVNEHGEMAYLVTPIYRTDGRLMSVPDEKGWPTLKEAIAEAEQMCGGKLEAL